MNVFIEFLGICVVLGFVALLALFAYTFIAVAVVIGLFILGMGAIAWLFYWIGALVYSLFKGN